MWSYYVHTYILCFFVLELNGIHTLVYLCDRVGIELPKIEVRFEHLKVVANVHVGSRALPTLINFTTDLLEVIYNTITHGCRR